MKGKLLYSHVLQPTAQCEPHLVTCELQTVDCLECINNPPSSRYLGQALPILYSLHAQLNTQI